jgi:tight adherence protein B
MIPLGVLMVFGGLGSAMFGLALMRKARRDSLARLGEAELADPSGPAASLADLMERAGHVADKALRRTRMIPNIQAMLGQAGWSLRAGEFAAAMAAGAAAVATFFWFVSGPALGVVAAILGPLVTIWWLDRTGKRRTRKLEQQLPNVLQLWAASLESGSSVLHAMELAREEGEDPISFELARVVAETKVGREVTEALHAMAERVRSRDLEWTVEAIVIQHKTGGRLSDTLRVLAEFMRARQEVQGEVRALSAEALLSAKVLTALPFLLGSYFFLFRRAYLAPLYQTSLGRMMLLLALGGVVLGTFWMRRIVRVEV